MTLPVGGWSGGEQEGNSLAHWRPVLPRGLHAAGPCPGASTTRTHSPSLPFLPKFSNVLLQKPPVVPCPTKPCSLQCSLFTSPTCFLCLSFSVTSGLSFLPQPLSTHLFLAFSQKPRQEVPDHPKEGTSNSEASAPGTWTSILWKRGFAALTHLTQA